MRYVGFFTQRLYDLLLVHKKLLQSSNFVRQNARQTERFDSLFKRLLQRRIRCFKGIK